MIKHCTFKCIYGFKALLLIVILTAPLYLFAQDNTTITGKILLSNPTDELNGTSINVKNKTQGTLTDATGNFSLTTNLPATLIVSRVGYATVEVNIKDAQPVNLTLTVGAGSNLNEVVVVAYGTNKKRDITSAVSNVNAAELKDIAAAEFGQKLQGQVAGLQINQATGRPGQGMDFRLRGAGSLSGGYQPLIVVDGQPLSGTDTKDGGMNLINPDDIESFSVLKDAASAALYGSRAANGVIIITTKQAKAGRTNITFDTYMGWQKVPQKGRPDLMNAKEFATYMKGWYEDKAKYEGYAGGIPVDYRDSAIATYGAGTNWYDAILRTAPMQNYTLNISTGTDKVLSSTSFSYFNQNGILLNTYLKRFSLRTNNEYRFNDKIRVGVNLAPTYQIDHNTKVTYTDGNRLIIGNTTSASPLFPIYNPDGRYISRVSSTGMQGYNNPVQQLNLLNGNQKTVRFLGNAYGEIELVKDLRFKTSLNTDLGAGEFNQFFGTMYGIGLSAAPIPRPSASTSSTNNSYNYVSWLNENTLHYNKTFNDHHFDVLAGYTAQRWEKNARIVNGSNFPTDNIEWVTAATTVTLGAHVPREVWSMTSQLGRLMYDFKGKYLLSATIRRDGSSRFGEETKFGWYPSVSAGWIASDEAFFTNKDVISFLKLRASYGRAGNFNIPYYEQYTSIGASNYVFGGTTTPGLSPGTILGNPVVTWENSDQFDIGLEVNFLKNRINFSYDYYNKKTYQMLYAVPLPAQSGYLQIRDNVGEFRMWGHEFQINSKNLTGELKWNTDFNIAFGDNKVIALPDNVPFIGGGPRYSGWNRTQVNRRIGEFYGYVFDGVYMTQAEFDSQPKESTSKVGTVRMKDVDGNGKIDENDRTLIGNPNPKFTFGLTNTFYYKNFDLNIIMAGQYGNQILNGNLQDLHNLDGGFNLIKDMANRWRSEQDPGNGLVPRTHNNTTELYRLANSGWIFDGSYLTAKNIAFGYTIKPKMAYLKAARIYGSIQQAFVLTKYKGNPEVNFGRDNVLGNYGQDLNPFPVPRTFMIGANLTF